ncbi:MAG: SGNH/GDSL hydrolase family protein [Eubacteriales bacterium]|nr:SGNH/GDSL hydrolase family protein [Eubacteriales bacterium]
MKNPKKGNTFLVFFGIFFAVCMVGLAAYVTVFLNTDQTILAPESTDVLISAPEETAAAETLSQTDTFLASHSLLFLGDSRTAGMRNALAELGVSDPCSYLAKDGEGCYWLRNTALPELTARLDQEPDTIVITNLGVNDLTECASYLSLYHDLLERYPTTPFYIMSVNPASDDCSMVANADIESFNQTMQDEFPDLYFDCYHYLMDNGYETVDGLHYTQETYAKIYDYAIKEAAGR